MTNHPMPSRRAALPVLLASLLFLGAGCFGGGGPVVSNMELTYWSTDADAEAMQAVIAEYRKIHPNIGITLTVMRKDDYKTKLLEALAEDRGPDLFTLPNTDMIGWKAKLLPMPEKISIATRTVGDDGKVTTVARETDLPSKSMIIRDFVETVPKDIYSTVMDPETEKVTEHLYGLPLSLDTPALFYNIDLLKSASITEPPATWRQVQDEVVKLTQKDATTGALRQSGIAIGLAENVLHYTDILVSLMMQNGAVMISESTRRAVFQAFTPATMENAYPPGVEALMFYDSFAEPNAITYTWDAEQPVSLDAFVTGKTAFFIGFPADVATVRERAPRLNFDIAPLPLIDESRKITVAHYPVEVVSAKTKHPGEAWDFLLFMTQPEQASPYLIAAKRPTALRALIAEQLSNADLKAFAGQVLTAKSWYRGPDYAKVEDIFAAMILRKPTERLPSYEPIVADAATAIDRIR